MANYYSNLPEGYQEKFVIDVNNDKKWRIYLNFIHPFLLLIFSIIVSLIKGIEVLGDFLDNEYLLFMIISLVIYLILFFIYVVIHELVHGLFYKIMTKQKLTFGLTKGVAFCGVPNIYTNRKTALISTLAPFVVFTIIFGLLVIFLPANMWGFVFVLMLVSHLLGCSCDLYVAYILMFKLPKRALMNDTGPKQTFYVNE